MRNAAFTALITSLLLAVAGVSLAVSERARTSSRLDQRLALQADGEADAVGGVFASTRLALRLLASDGTFRDGLATTAPDALRHINRTLGSLERADAGVVGAASAIGLDGRERARVVQGRPAPAEALARDVRDDAFFRATLGTGPGEVHVSEPYRSADTGRLVVSSSVLVRDDAGAPLGILRVELPLAHVSAVATAALGEERRAEIALVERASGRALLDTTRGVLAWQAGPAGRVRATGLQRPRQRRLLGRWQPPVLPRADRRPRRARLGDRRVGPAAAAARSCRALARGRGAPGLLAGARRSRA